LVSLCLFCTTLLIVSTTSSANTDRKVEKERIEKGIDTFRINISKLKKGISIQQDLILSSKEQERNLLEELAKLDNSLQEQLTKLNDFEKEMVQQQQLISLKEKEEHDAEQAKQRVETHLKNRMKAYYKMGRIGIANVVFSSESLPRMLSFRDSFTSLMEYDTEVIKQYRLSITSLQQSQDTLTLEKSILKDFIHEARKKQQAINKTMQEKETLLSQIKTQTELHQQAVVEMENAADNLTESLNNLKRKNELFDQGFLLDKGKHPAPVQGKVLAFFGQQRENRLGIKSQSTGITISTPGTHRVDAIFEGEIRYANYLRGYGNTIIIDHGFQYFSIISRLEKILKKKGEKVFQGDIIGLTGDTATLMDEGIYFEIRHGSTPLDPLEWIDKKGLMIAPDQK
jgi:septal ring factor EnvC (AmiA/AmiB activator)